MDKTNELLTLKSVKYGRRDYYPGIRHPLRHRAAAYSCYPFCLLDRHQQT